MKKTQNFLKGLFRKESFVFISKSLEHIELVTLYSIFGKWVVYEVSREVYIPQLKADDTDGLLVIVEAYTEIQEAAKELKEFDQV